MQDARAALMVWARIDDGYFTHHKTAALSKDAKLLDLAGITFSARELRDGKLTDRDVRIVAAEVDVVDLSATLDELRLARRWVRFDGGWEIHDYLEYNPSREQVIAEKAGSAKRMRGLRQRQRYGVTAPVTNGVTNGVSHGVSHGVGSEVPDPVNDPVKAAAAAAAATPARTHARTRRGPMSPP